MTTLALKEKDGLSRVWRSRTEGASVQFPAWPVIMQARFRFVAYRS